MAELNELQNISIDDRFEWGTDLNEQLNISKDAELEWAVGYFEQMIGIINWMTVMKAQF